MPGRWTDRLDRPMTFVVGKGGVGKSTTAAGLALSLADDGVPTHLLSTDPAHSIADLFREDAPLAEPRPAACSGRLVLEELDAERLVAARLGALSPALRELIDRGTYLDPEDAGSLLDAALPGLDEIGAALRVGTLAATGGRVVVDTAPTGHTLRLLDVPRTLRGWVRVFRAMAAKADTVATALVGRPVRLEAEDRLDELIGDIDRFATALHRADFVVVTAPGRVVEAETRRLLAALRERELRVSATVAVARPDARADVLLPVRPALAGCDALRRWWSDGVADGQTTESGPMMAGGQRRPQRSPARPARPGEPGVASPAMAPALPPALDRGFVLFAGKGGVGKTTCAAAAAVAAAGRRPVVLLGVDPAGSLNDVIPAPPPDLEVRELDAEGELDRLKGLYRAEVEAVFAAVGLDRSARLDREVVESLWELAPPGIDELMAVGRLTDDAPAASRLVLDTAPTGHFLRLVGMPELALDWTHRIMRILLKYRALGSLDAPADHLLRFARRFRGLRERLADPSRTAIVLVTLDEPVARAETLRLARRLDGLGLAPAAMIVNRTTRPVTPDLPVPTWAAPEVTEPVGADALADFVGRWERLA